MYVNPMDKCVVVCVLSVSHALTSSKHEDKEDQRLEEKNGGYLILVPPIKV